MDVTGCLNLWGGGADGAVRMMNAIKQEILRECGLSVSIGIASNKVCAKIAAGLRKPDGLVMVPAGSEREFLAPLPVEVIPGVGRKTLPRLQARGIMTVGDLLHRPGQGDSALDRYLTAVAEGRDDRVIRSHTVEKSMSRDTTFGHDTDDRTFIGSTLYYLTERCCRALRERSMAATTVTAKVRFSDFTTLQKQATLAVATDREEEVFALAQRLVDTVLPPGQMVRLVGVKVSGLVPREGAGCQLTLDTVTEERLDRLHQRIDALRKKFGYASIQRGRTVMLQKTFVSDDHGYEMHSPVYEL
jgi:DNA polymerase-4